MVAKEYKETTGVYKVQTFRTTHNTLRGGFLLTNKFSSNE